MASDAFGFGVILFEWLWLRDHVWSPRGGRDHTWRPR
jgi:hypothetical protein